jgi:hypothetical protein
MNTKLLSSVRSEYLRFAAYLTFVAIVKGLSRFHIQFVSGPDETHSFITTTTTILLGKQLPRNA